MTSGGLLFYSQPMRFYPNFWFWLKNLLLLLALANAIVFPPDDVSFGGRVGQRPGAAVSRAVGGGLGLVLWASIIVTGRMIAYSGLVPQWWLDHGLTVPQ